MSSFTFLRILLLVQFHALLTRSDATVSIGSGDVFNSQRTCARTTFGDNAEYLAQDLSCKRPYYNSCFCRPDLEPEALSWVSSTVGYWCSGNKLDISTAVSLYTSYCNNVNAVATSATPTGASTVTITVTTPGATAEATATVTASVTVTVRSGVATTPGPSAMFLLLASLPLGTLLFGRS